MENRELNILELIKLEKRSKIVAAICLSVVLLTVIFVLALLPMEAGLSQALVVVLGLIVIATVDAFSKATGTSYGSMPTEFKPVIFEQGGSYFASDAVNVQGNYVRDGVINYDYGKQSLTEAAKEIQDLLQQLEKTSPTATESEKVAYLDQKVEPELKSRLSETVQEVVQEIIGSSIDSRYVSILKSALKLWS